MKEWDYVLCKGRNMEDLRYTTGKVERKRDGWMDGLFHEPLRKKNHFWRAFGGGSHPSISLAKMVVKHQRQEKFTSSFDWF